MTPQQFRPLQYKSDSMALGCSHTWGVGVECHEAWPHLLNAMNFGLGGASADCVVRMGKKLLSEHKISTVYVLWPDWTRFEYEKDGKLYQSLPTDPDRIYRMDTHDETWLKKNFETQTIIFLDFCKDNNVKLIDMTLYDLVPIIDHADKWPLSKLGHHYSPEWHQWVADIFVRARDTNQKFLLSYD